MTPIPASWKPISSAPKDGTDILAWREDCGQFIAKYTSADAFPMTQDELDAMDEETLFAKDWFTQWPDATRLDGSEAPTLWQPLPVDPCPTCNDRGAVGNILNAVPCPDCTPASVAPGDAQDERQAFDRLPAYITDDRYHLQYRLGWNNCLADCRAAILADAPAAGDARAITLPAKMPKHEGNGSEYPSSESYHEGYAEGWNDAIDAAIAAQQGKGGE